MLPISRVVGNKVQCLRKNRPVTPAELWNNTEGKRNTNTKHQYSAKNVPVIPRFSRIPRSPLARARILPSPKER